MVESGLARKQLIKICFLLTKFHCFINTESLVQRLSQMPCSLSLIITYMYIEGTPPLSDIKDISLRASVRPSLFVNAKNCCQKI